MKEFVLKWWPIPIVVATMLSILSPVYRNNYWAILPSMIAAGILGYAAQVYWDSCGKRPHWAQIFIVVIVLQYGQLLNALWLERVAQAKLSALFIGMFFVTICGMGAGLHRGKSAKRDTEKI